MIACDRCRKRVESSRDLRGTYQGWNEIEIFKDSHSLCNECYKSWDAMREALKMDIEVYIKQEGARRMAEWMGSAEVVYDPWSEAAETGEDGGKTWECLTT